MKNPNGASIEEIECWLDELRDQHERPRNHSIESNTLCKSCGQVYSDPIERCECGSNNVERITRQIRPEIAALLANAPKTKALYQKSIFGDFVDEYGELLRLCATFEQALNTKP